VSVNAWTGVMACNWIRRYSDDRTMPRKVVILVIVDAIILHL